MGYIFEVSVDNKIEDGKKIYFKNQFTDIEIPYIVFLQIVGALWEGDRQLLWTMGRDITKGTSFSQIKTRECWVEVIYLGDYIEVKIDYIKMTVRTEEYHFYVDKILPLVNNIVDIEGFNINLFTPDLFKEIASWIPDLISVKFDDVYLEEVYDTAEWINPKTGEVKYLYKPLKETRILKSLRGDFGEVENHVQNNLIQQSNMDRVKRMLLKISKDGYPFDDKYIVLFNEGNVLLDGLHRASCLYFLYGNIRVKMMRLSFLDNKYGPYLYCLNRESFKDFFKKHSYIYIYGAGDYGKAVLRRVEAKGLKIEGFIVTDRQDVDVVSGKRVYELDEIPYASGLCGIIFGLHSRHHKNITAKLLDKGFHNLYKFDNYEYEIMKSLNT